MTVPAESVPFGALLTPMPMRTAGERVAERFVTAIALGEFVSGQRLPTERELAALLAVSRTTVREAIQRLQASGYVRTRRGRGGGTFVAADLGPDSDEMIRRTLVPAWQELTELLEFRQLIERMIARTAAERRDDSDVAAIRKAVEAYAKADSRDACRVADHALHRAIATATHNRHPVDLSTRIRRQVSLGFDAEPRLTGRRIRVLRSTRCRLCVAVAIARCRAWSATRQASLLSALAYASTALRMAATSLSSRRSAAVRAIIRSISWRNSSSSVSSCQAGTRVRRIISSESGPRSAATKVPPPRPRLVRT